MSSVKKWVVGAAAGAVICAAVDAGAQDAPTLVVDRQSQTVQTPTTPGQAGIAYQQTGSGTSSLKVYTEGFLFCGSVGQPSSTPTPTTLMLAHENQSVTPVHTWAFPSVTVGNFGYSGGELNVLGDASVLTCLGTREDGSVVSGLREGVFDDGYDPVAQTNYGHLVNWIPPQGFNWLDPDWTQVPTDACNPTSDQPAKVAEDVACVAVTGVKAPATDGGDVRAPTMWTATDGVSFTYLFRFDGRQGPQTSGAQATFQAPQTTAPDEPADASFPNILIQDAYDHGYLSTSGQYCILTELPTTLNSGTCANAGTTLPFDASGFVHLPIILGQLPIGSGVDQAFYVVVTRGISGAPSATAPVVAASVLIEPAAASAGGDNFSGDDVVFGFMPTSSGFPWMGGSQ